MSFHLFYNSLGILFIMKPMPEQSNTTIQSPGPLVKFDGTIPAWGIIMLGLAWITYSWTSLQDLNHRVTVTEAGSTEYRKKVDTLEKNRDVDLILWNNINADVRVMKELLVRIEQRIPK